MTVLNRGAGLYRIDRYTIDSGHGDVDGAEVAKDDLPPLLGDDGGLYIGAGRNLEPDSFFSGLIDDVRIYDRAIAP